MGLFGLFGKKKNVVKKSNKVDLNHLDADGDLPWGWFAANKEFTEKIEAEYAFFSDAYFQTPKADIQQRCAALKSLVKYMESVKKLCVSKGECFEYWASNLVANEQLLKQRKEELKYLEDNMGKLLKQEQQIKNLQPDIIKILKIQPGILQSDLFKHFDPEIKQHIQEELYIMEKHGKITKEKSGRSYKIMLK